MPRPLTIAYLFTTFPKPTETFLQREVAAMLARGAQLRIYSLWGGGGDFRGVPVIPFPKTRLLTLLWWIPREARRRPAVLRELLRGLIQRRPPSWMNAWENLLGAGFACLWAREFRADPPDLIHAAWSGAPATAAWLLHRLDGYRYTAAAHAYDVYEHGGDWWLREKLAIARGIHTSTAMVGAELVARGVDPGKIHVIRRGLETLPVVKPLRAPRLPLRIVCLARLVEKKGLDLQLRIYAALAEAGLVFEARIAGSGPLQSELESLRAMLGLDAQVQFVGHQAPAGVAALLAWADVLVHTGVVAPSGDRDGLPNVIPEAMAAGVLVVTSPEAATTEAITAGVSGLVADPRKPAAWVAALQRLRDDEPLAERLRTAARAWVEQHFNAHHNAARIYAMFEAAAER